MAAVIKAHHQRHASGGARFNLSDVEQRAELYLAEVRGKAEEIIAAARREAEQIRRQAAAEGMAQAREAAEAQSGDLVARRMQTVLPALDAAADQLRLARDIWLARWEGDAVHLASLIAAKVIRRELVQAPQITLALVREALELAAAAEKVRVHLNPRDADTLGEEVRQIIERFSKAAPAELVPDSEVSPGGCVVKTEFGEIDQRIEAQLARIEQELA